MSEIDQKPESKTPLAAMTLSEIYLSWVNDFISVQGFADYYDISVSDAVRLINTAREAHEAACGG